ncbi:MAG: thioredoxin family protein [Chloroflexota bacterium]|nr:thioredoxin family protein [Chloroflexota bacterium]
MVITAEQFATGMTMNEYQAQMSQNQEQFDANIAAAPITPEDVARFTALPEPLNVLVVTEDWCGDSLAHLPVLFRLARESGDRLTVRVFKRDEHKELAAQFPMPTGRVAIPIIVFFDQGMHELGKVLERPQLGHTEMAAFMAEFFASHPDLGTPGQSISTLTPEARQALFVALGPWRKGRVDAWNRAAIAEFTDVAAAAPVTAR